MRRRTHRSVVGGSNELGDQFDRRYVARGLPCRRPGTIPSLARSIYDHPRRRRHSLVRSIIDGRNFDDSNRQADHARRVGRSRANGNSRPVVCWTVTIIHCRCLRINLYPTGCDVPCQTVGRVFTCCRVFRSLPFARVFLYDGVFVFLVTEIARSHRLHRRLGDARLVESVALIPHCKYIILDQKATACRAYASGRSR